MAVFYFIEVMMEIFIYSDESGVFDSVHNEIFVFGGLIILGSDQKELWSRKYAAMENNVRNIDGYSRNLELKATNIAIKSKNTLYKSLNSCYKFGVVIKQRELLDRIFLGKKDKQRYLDYSYKIGVKKALKQLISSEVIRPNEVERIHFFIDEHTTSTNGRYELREGLEQEFKNGTYNYKYSYFYPPIFEALKEVRLEFCNSNSKYLIRAADIVANRVYYEALVHNRTKVWEDYIFVSKLP